MSHALNLATVVGANDRLLKALITLLALRDRQLLEELDVIFRRAGASIRDAGAEADAAWAHVARELELIAELVADADGEESATIAPRTRLSS